MPWSTVEAAITPDATRPTLLTSSTRHDAGRMPGVARRDHWLVRCLSLLLCLLATSSAIACPYPGQEQTVFFEENDISAGADDPAIAEVTIKEVRPSTDNKFFVGVATVERIIKGPIDGPAIHILVLPTSCLRGFGEGVHGIVAGTIHRNAEGVLELIARTDTPDARRLRRR